jgi:hypothetical protein
VITIAAIERDTVIVACSVSAGVHAALTPEHFAERTAAGLGFLASVVVLAGLVVALTWRPASPAALVGAVLVFGGLIASYVLAITSGFPLLHPEPEPVDRLALFTKTVEVVGLFAAGHLLWRSRPALALTFPRMKGTLS